MTDDMAGTETTSQIHSRHAATEQHEETEAHPEAGGEPDGTTATAPAAGQAGPIPRKNRGVAWLWGLTDAVPRRWWGAMAVGALIVMWVALDIPLGNPLLLVLAIAAHGCLGIFCFQLYDELRRLATHVGDPKPGPLVWPWLKWLINIGWLSLLLAEIDRFVWRAPLDLPYRYPARPPSFVDGLPPGSTVPDSDASASHDDCSVLLAPTRDVEHT